MGKAARIDNTTTHWLPIDSPRHTEVLGCRVSSRIGKKDFARLDWSNWWIDGPEPHIFNPGGHYFHVPIKDIPGDPADGRVYRVRCWYAGGTYRGREVTGIGIGMKNGKLHWMVRTKPTE